MYISLNFSHQKLLFKTTFTDGQNLLREEFYNISWQHFANKFAAVVDASILVYDVSQPCKGWLQFALRKDKTLKTQVNTLTTRNVCTKGQPKH